RPRPHRSQWFVSGDSPLLDAHDAIRAVAHAPGAVARSPHRQVGAAVAVVIARHGHVALDPELLRSDARTGRAGDDVPVAFAWPPHGEVGPAVSVVVFGDRNVARHPPLLPS